MIAKIMANNYSSSALLLPHYSLLGGHCVKCVTAYSPSHLYSAKNIHIALVLERSIEQKKKNIEKDKKINYRGQGPAGL